MPFTTDKRIAAILSMVPQTETVAEIGADHGRISAALVFEKLCQKVLVSDISAASLEKAKQLFQRMGIMHRAEFRVADGFEGMHGNPGAVIIAGMGTNEIIKILQNGGNCCDDCVMILQSITDIPQLRAFLDASSFRILDESIVFFRGRFYVTLKAFKEEMPFVGLTQKEICLGPVLMKKKPLNYEGYLCTRLRYYQSRKNADRQVGWVMEELHDLQCENNI